jgi:toxin FitB
MPAPLDPKYLLDTNIVSMLDPRRHQHAPALIDWLERHGARLFLSVMTIAEMDSGVFKLRRDGKPARADAVSALVSTVLSEFADRVLAFDVETARHLARLGSETYQQPVALPDLIIAATAARHGLVVLTRNMKDFRRLNVDAVDPFASLPPEI